VLARGSPGPRPPVARFRPGTDRPPLVCIHPAGGSAFCYLELARALPSTQPVYGVQEPFGMVGSELRVEDRAAAYRTELESRVPAGPWHLAGHSFGGLIALEIARQGLASGHASGLVLLLDTAAPRGEPRRDAGDPVAALEHILEDPSLDDEVALDPRSEHALWSALARFAAATFAGEPGRPARLGTLERFCHHH